MKHRECHLPERAYFFLVPPELFLARPERLRGGTRAPLRLASLNPMATACLRLVTFFPDPERSVPLFLLRIARFTDCEAFFE